MKTYIKKALLAFSLTLVTVCSYASSTFLVTAAVV